MAQRVALNVSLTQELAEFVRSEVASGQYGSASEVIRTSLRLLVQSKERRMPSRHDAGETQDA